MINNSITTSKVEYDDIFSDDVIKQKQITHLYVNLMTTWENLLKCMPVYAVPMHLFAKTRYIIIT